jgi:hypothetical protein
MNRQRLVKTLMATVGIASMSAPLFAAEPELWPWKSKLPPDPALVVLTSIEDVSAKIDKAGDPPTVTISVNASAPTPNFSELQLAPRIGNRKDLVFAFDAKGRPPQDLTTQVVTPVSFTIAYKDAPIEKVGVIEVHAQSSCKAFSITENKAVECTSQSTPQ